MLFSVYLASAGLADAAFAMAVMMLIYVGGLFVFSLGIAFAYLTDVKQPRDHGKLGHGLWVTAYAGYVWLFASTRNFGSDTFADFVMDLMIDVVLIVFVMLPMLLHLTITFLSQLLAIRLYAAGRPRC